MTLETVFKDLAVKWERLAEELEHGLLWSVTETKPTQEHALATHYLDAATDLIALAREGLETCRAADNGTSLSKAGQSILRSQERYNVLAEQFESRMASFDRLRRLQRFGREKRGAWRDWAVHVRKALDRCRQSMDDLNRALFGCWQELADRVGISTVSVQSTNIGQHITMSQTEETVDAMT